MDSLSEVYFLPCHDWDPHLTIVLTLAQCLLPLQVQVLYLLCFQLPTNRIGGSSQPTHLRIRTLQPATSGLGHHLPRLTVMSAGTNAGQPSWPALLRVSADQQADQPSWPARKPLRASTLPNQALNLSGCGPGATTPTCTHTSSGRHPATWATRSCTLVRAPRAVLKLTP